MPTSDDLSQIMGAEPPLSEVENPQSNQQVYDASFSGILRKALGYYVVCEFLIGTTLIVEKDGILYSSGINYATLYQAEYNRFVVCDLYSLKFLTIYPTKTKPRFLAGETSAPSPSSAGIRYPADGQRNPQRR